MLNTYRSFWEIIRAIECEPYVFRLDCIICVRHMATASDESSIRHHFGEDHVFFLQAKLWRKDSVTGVESWGQGAKYFLSPYAATSEVVRTALKACLAYAEHECRESFRYQGKRIFGPHLSVLELSEVADELDTRH